MKITLLSMLLALTVFCSCNKKEITQTRVGFYVLNPNYVQVGDGSEYDLFINSEFKGKLYASTSTTEDSALMNFQTLNTKKHIIEVKKAGILVSSTYLKVSDCKGESGTAELVQGYINGSTFTRKPSMNFATYAILQ